MLSMLFKPSNPSNFDLKLATYNYERIWNEDRENIIAKYKDLTGLEFRQRKLTAITIPGTESSSGMPGVSMKLAGDCKNDNERRSMLTHELAHRLLGGNKILIEDNARAESYIEHRRIDLFLYDAWCDLYGKGFAREAVARERLDAEYYGKAWDWALKLTRKQRQAKLQKIIQRKINKY